MQLLAILAQFPFSVVQWAYVARFEPARDTVEVEGVLQCSVRQSGGGWRRTNVCRYEGVRKEQSSTGRCIISDEKKRNSRQARYGNVNVRRVFQDLRAQPLAERR